MSSFKTPPSGGSGGFPNPAEENLDMGGYDITNIGTVDTSDLTVANPAVFDTGLSASDQIRSEDNGGFIITEDVVNGSNEIGIYAPSALSSSFDLTLPDALPSVPSVLASDSSGNLSMVSFAFKYSKPAFQANSADTSQILINAGSVLINGVVYTNSSNATVDLDTSGRSGLDTGTKAADTVYYVYAIPPTSGSTFDGIVSTTAPTGAGPTGFTSTWSYLGSFRTVGSSAVPFFRYSNGQFVSSVGLQDNSTTGTSAQTKTYTVSAISKSAYGLFYVTGTSLTDYVRLNPISALTVASGIFARVYSSGNFCSNWITIPWDTVGTLYMLTENAVNTVGFRIFGWNEDPSLYQ